MPTPKKGPRIGRDPAHQRLILANMASSLFEAGYVVTTVNRAKMLRPYAEHIITKAKKGGVHQRRQVIATIHDQDVTHKLFAEIGPRYRDRPGGYLRILKLGPRPGDRRAHGAHRTGVTQLPLEGAGVDRTLKLTVAYDGTDFHGFAAQPGTRTVEGVLSEALALVLRARRPCRSSARDAPTPGVHAWGQVVSLPVAADVDVDRVAAR